MQGKAMTTPTSIVPTSPKVFISYSWSSLEHKLLVKTWAEQLIADGIEVILDVYDLKEGHDKYAFMEKMVTDPSVTHVLVICDQQYSEKANGKKGGVGTESQIISPEVYNKVAQSKFIPIVCQFDAQGEPFLPVFFKSRIWIDFSTPEAANKNWEQLVRVIYGKPEHEKPKIGKPPLYVTNSTATPTTNIQAKFNILKQVVLQEKPNLRIYRQDFLDACINYANGIKTREHLRDEVLGERVLEDARKLTSVRNHIIDWVLLESETKGKDFSAALFPFLERLIDVKARPAEITSWNKAWFEAQSVFVYETFLYIVASLIKTQSFEVLHEIFTTHYLLPLTLRHGDNSFDAFDIFYGHSDTLQAVLAPEGQRLHSPAAEFIQKHADRKDIPLRSIIEAELLSLIMSFLSPNPVFWFPQTFFYASYGAGEDFPFFMRATQHKHFAKLAIVTGVTDVGKLKETIRAAYEKFNSSGNGYRFHLNILEAMNLEKLDTLQ
jgi:hypothetical protein